MATNRDYYEILEINKSANKEEIKKAYRRLAKKYHPDINKEKDAENKFKEVKEAYDILSDESKRQLYDKYGHAGVRQNAGSSGMGGGFGDFGFEEFDMGDIFSSFFGDGSFSNQQRTSRSGPRRGRDRFLQMEISFMEAAFGKNKKISLDIEEKCDDCDGKGAQGSSDFENCSTCKGSGRIQTQQKTMFGTFQTSSVCPYCKGKGKVIKNKCSTCKGKGYNKKRDEVDVKIPAGINTGQQLRIKNKGLRGAQGGDNGDLYIEIIVAKHNFFERKGNDVYIKVPISYVQATLGTKIKVPTIHGDVEVSIPSGIQPKAKLRLKTKGIKDLRTGGFGDQYIIVDVKVPGRLSKKEKQIYKELQKEEKTKEGFFEKFKNSFKY